MYILIKEGVPTGFALVAAAHASLTAYLRFQDAEHASVIPPPEADVCGAGRDSQRAPT